MRDSEDLPSPVPDVAVGEEFLKNRHPDGVSDGAESAEEFSFFAGEFLEDGTGVQEKSISKENGPM